METEKHLLARDFLRPFTTVSKDELIPQAFWTLESTDDTHLVVVQDEKPIGIVSYKDFLRILAGRVRRKKITRLYVSGIMTTNLIYAKENDPIEKIANIMIEKGISSVLIFEDDTPKGIITKKDILKKIHLFPFCNNPVEEIMTQHPITAPSGLSITGAERLLVEKKISTLPIVEEGTLVGYLDIHILARFLISLYLNPEYKHPEKILYQLSVGELMKGPFYVFMDTPIKEFAQSIIRKKFKGAPVVLSDANRRVIGIVTETDIVQHLAKITGSQS